MIHAAYIAIGANLGDRVENCRQGVALLAADEDIAVTGHSPYYWSEPVGYADQPWFVNAVFSVATSLSPAALLKRLKDTECAAGRTKGGIRFGPRVLDLDIIFYDDIVLETPELVIPHPRMHERLFVLRPLCDLAPELIHPVFGIRADRLLYSLPADGPQCRRVQSEAESEGPAGAAPVY